MTSTTDPSPPQGDTELPSPPRITRRAVVRGLGWGGAALAVGATGALGYRTYDTAVLDPAGGPAHEPWRQWREVPGPRGAIAAAVLAASPHNTQPWEFAVTDRSIDVFTDPRRHTGSVDPFGRERYAGTGCALENLVLACGPRGLSPSVTLLPDGAGGERVARVDLVPVPPRTDPLYELIDRRHTNRGPYEPTPVPAAALTALAGPSLPAGLALHWITDPQPRAALGRLLVEAAEALVADEQQSVDNFAWFRPDNDAEQRHRDGLVLDGQGLGPVMLGVAKLLPPSSRTAGDRFWVDRTRDVHTATAAAYGVLTTATPDDRRVQLDAGRLLQRIHLRATASGIALHHMNQITERMDREGAAVFAPRFAALLPAGSHPLCTFRIGYPVRDGRPTPRRAAAAVTR